MKYVVTVNDKNYEVEVEKGEARVLSITNAALNVTQTVQAPIAAASAVPAPAPVAPAADQPGTALTAPMPGTILSVLKKTGDRVKAGDIVLILEAMKMENEIVAMTNGTISQVLVSKGASVTTGDPLVLIV